MIRAVRAFLDDRRGSISLEFAITLPVLLLVLCASAELTQVVRVKLKLQTAAWTVANYVASGSTVNATGLSDACAGSRLVMAPFQTAPLKITVASLTSSPSNVVGVDWQDTTCGSGTTVANPTVKVGSLASAPGDSVIMAAASYTYSPLLGYGSILPATLTLTETAYARPRSNKTISKN